MIVLGLSLTVNVDVNFDCAYPGENFFRDNGAGLIVDGMVVSAVDTGRLANVKRNNTPLPALRFVLKDYGIKFKDVDKIAVLGTEDGLNRDFNNGSPPGRERFIDTRMSLSGLFQEVFHVDMSDGNLSFIDPHFAYAANALRILGCQGGLVLTMDKTHDRNQAMFKILNLEKEAGTVLDSFLVPLSLPGKSTEDDILDRLSHHSRELGHPVLCITGNLEPPFSLEEKISSAGIFADLFTQPAGHAAGDALGAALYLYHQEKSKQPLTGKKHETYSNDTERILSETWQELLSKEKIGINDDFFALGGNSLKGLVLENEIHKKFNVKLSLAEIFKYPTIKELSQCIAGLATAQYTALEPVEKKDYYASSPAQQRLYIIQQMELSSTAYNMPQRFYLSGVLDLPRLEQSFNKLVRRHESFRTSFHMVRDNLVQRVHDKVEFKIEYGDSAGEFVRPFNLSRAPLLRTGLEKIGPDRHLLMVDMHHIISDGISISLFFQEFMTLYSGRDLPPLRLQYKDFTGWQSSREVEQLIGEQEEYWLKEFPGEIPVLNLPVDFTRPIIQRFEGSTFYFEITREDTGALNRLALEQGTTLYMVLLAVYTILLSKLSSQEDIVVGTPVAGRRHSDLKKIVGFFVNTLALRNYPAGQKTFVQFLEEVKNRTLDAFLNQDYQYDELVAALGAERDTQRNPLFDTMFVLQNVDIPEVDLPGLKINPDDQYENLTAKFDMTLSSREEQGKLSCSCEYVTKLFKKETIERFSIYFQKILSAVLGNRAQKIAEIEIITAEEKQRILFDFNATAAAYPGDKPLQQWFAEQVARTPDHLALVGPKLQNTKYKLQTSSKFQITNYKQSDALRADVNAFGEVDLIAVTYKELNEKSNRLAYYLIEKGVMPDTIVGIMMERSLEMMVGIFGILRAGGAYMPIDPGYPGKRIDYMLADSDAKVLVTMGDLSKEIEFAKEIVSLADASDRSPIPHHPGMQPGDNAPATSLAYVIYTSGSTGYPKGVLLQHRSVVNRLNWMQKIYPIDERDTLLQKTTYTFDVSVVEIFWWSMTGARLRLLEPGGEKDPAIIIDNIETAKVTVVHFVPSMLSVFLDYLKENREAHRLSGLNYVIASGEALTTAHVNRFYQVLGSGDFSPPKLTNLYGPTEAAVEVSSFDCSAGLSPAAIPIGKPIDNIRLYVLDKYLSLQPVGIPGELGIAGDGLARGYLNRPELTCEKFKIINYKLKIKNGSGALRAYLNACGEITPASAANPSVSEQCRKAKSLNRLGMPSPHPLYKTGDLARWLPDGNIDFLGRIDHQVKIRGHRVEPGEVETQLLNHKDIKEAAVVVKEYKSGDKYLCGYIVPRGKSAFETSGLTEYLSGKLPDYMIPTHFVLLEKIPLTPNGKVDRNALPTPGLPVEKKYIAPRNKLEEMLVEIWSGVLDLEKNKISIDANFFQLGGHSLKATVLAAKIHKVFDVKISLAKIFKMLSIKELAKYIKGKSKEYYRSLEPTEEKEYYELSPAQKRLYIVQQLDPGSTAYNMTKIVSLREKPGRKRLVQTFEKLLGRHGNLRTSFELINDKPMQRVHHPRSVTFIPVYYNHSNNEEAIIKDFIRPFNLAEAPILRVGIITLWEDRHILMVDMHHIVSDGTSDDILVGEFIALYPGETLPPLKLRYKDYSEWFNTRGQKEVLEQQEAHWLRIYSGEIPVLNLPGDYPRPAVRSSAGDIVRFEMDSKQTRQLKEIALQESVTTYMLILAIYYVLLAKLTGQEDIIVGTDVENRRHEGLEGIIGMFVNTLALRNFPKGENPFNVFLKEVKNRTLNDFENQEYPFEDLVDRLEVNRDPGRNPLFDVMFALQIITLSSTAGEKAPGGKPGLNAIPYDFKRNTAKFDLLLGITDQGDHLLFNLEYCTKLFSEETITHFIKNLKEIVTTVIKNTGIKIKDIVISHDLLTAQKTFSPVEFGF